MSNNRKPIVAIIGAGECSAEQSEMAYKAGKRLAELGGILVCGGRSGISKAAAHGARDGGGQSIGLLPGNSKDSANEYVEIAIPTGLGETRNVLVVRAADAVIAFPGKYGTLTEIAFALLEGKPIVSVGSWKIDSSVLNVADPIEAAETALKLSSREK